MSGFIITSPKPTPTCANFVTTWFFFKVSWYVTMVDFLINSEQYLSCSMTRSAIHLYSIIIDASHITQPKIHYIFLGLKDETNLNV